MPGPRTRADLQPPFQAEEGAAGIFRRRTSPAARPDGSWWSLGITTSGCGSWTGTRQRAAMGWPARPELRQVSDAPLNSPAVRGRSDAGPWSQRMERRRDLAAASAVAPNRAAWRKRGAKMRHRTMWRLRSPPLASTSKVSARGFDRTVRFRRTSRGRSRPGDELVSSHGSTDRSRGRSALGIAGIVGATSSRWNLPWPQVMN